MNISKLTPNTSGNITVTSASAITSVPLISTPVAVAKFTTSPLSISCWVIAYVAVNVVLSVSPEIDFVKVGDTIEYPKDLDWEFIVNRTVYFYIKWTHQIIRVNGELVNDYNEIVPQPANIEKFGLILPNTERFNECIEGKFEGKRILPDRKRIELSKYIKSQFIFGHLE